MWIYNQNMSSENPLLTRDRFESVFCRDPVLLSNARCTTVIFGNSGFMLVTHSNGEVKTFHFTPEDKAYADSFSKAKYAKLLGSALFGLWLWLNEPPPGHLQVSEQFDYIRTVANVTMVNAIRNLFDRFSHGEMITVNKVSQYGFEFIMKIDLLKYRCLESHDPLIEKLRLFDTLAKKVIVKR